MTTVKGKPVNVDVEASEKLYADFQLTATNPGGHSSLPVPDNAIYHIADALSRLEHAPFPFDLNPVTRDLLRTARHAGNERTAGDMKAILQTPPDPAAIARLSAGRALQLHDCAPPASPTRLSAGHANNALPQLAQANVNCRILPGHSDGGNSTETDPDLRRSEDHRALCGQRRRRSRSRSGKEGFSLPVMPRA